jgi:hypothetical protein
MISGGAEVFCDYLARYVERIVEKLLTTKLPVFFLLDEPLLETNPFTGILLRRLEKTWAIPGVHSCGATGAGLSLTPPPEIIALDCSGQVAPLRALLAGVHPHTASGRRLALGLSPRDSAAEIRTLKWEILSAFSETETVFDPERVLLTPPCGLAFQTPDHARAVFAALARLREELLTETGTIKDTATEGA